MTVPLLPRVAAGDQTAVRECLARYGGLVVALARRWLGPGADADDAVQDVFIDLWRCAGRFDPARAAETTFVAMIARRRLIDVRRREQRQPHPQPLPEALAAAPVADDVATADEAARARHALSELRPEQREAVTLAVLHGLTHEQVAARTGQPLGTVKTHIRRGLQKVRQCLDAGRGGQP